MEDVVGHRTEEDVAETASTLMAADDQQIKLLVVGNMADGLPRITKFEELIGGEPGFPQCAVHPVKEVFARPGRILFDHLHLKLRDHPVGELLLVDDVEQGEVLGEVLFEIDDGVDCSPGGWRFIDWHEYFWGHFSLSVRGGVAVCWGSAVDQPGQEEDNIRLEGKEQQDEDLQE